MPKQTRSQNQRNKANRTSDDIPEDLNKLYVKELRDLCKSLGHTQDGGWQEHTNQLEQARENHVQDQSVGVKATMTSHQLSGTASTTFSHSQCQKVLDLMKTAISDVAEAAAFRAINSFQQLQAHQSNPTTFCETETIREVNMASREGLVMAPNDLIQSNHNHCSNNNSHNNICPMIFQLLPQFSNLGLVHKQTTQPQPLYKPYNLPWTPFVEPYTILALTYQAYNHRQPIHHQETTLGLQHHFLVSMVCLKFPQAHRGSFEGWVLWPCQIVKQELIKTAKLKW